MRNRSRGAAMVEFALALPLLMILVLGTIDGARLYATWNRAKTGAREGATYAQFFPLKVATGTLCANPNNITARARNEGSDLTITVAKGTALPFSATLCENLPSTKISPGDTVTVTVTAPFSFVSPVARALWGNPPVKATVRVTVQG